MSKDENKWTYEGRTRSGKPKFRRRTNQSAEHVKNYLSEKGIAYVYLPSATMFFIYKEAEPKSIRSPRYSYYYTTGMWGSDKRTKHYHCKGIEHFIETYYKTLEESIEYWRLKNE